LAQSTLRGKKARMELAKLQTKKEFLGIMSMPSNTDRTNQKRQDALDDFLFGLPDKEKQEYETLIAETEAKEAEARREARKKKDELEKAKTNLALLVQSKVRGKNARALLEIQKQEAQKYLDKLLEDIVAEQAEVGAKREIRMEGQRLSALEAKAFQERKEQLINRLMTKWTALGLERSDPRLEQFTQDYVAGATEVSESGKLPLTNQIIDEFILNAKREEDILRQELALVERDREIEKQTKLQARMDKAKAKAQKEAEQELARQEAVRKSDEQNPLSLSNFKTRLKKTKILSVERQKERDETLAYNKRLEEIQREREALEAALDEANKEAEIAAQEAEAAEREAQAAEREAQIGKPATELEQRAAAETPKRGRPPAPRPRVITKEAREAKAALRAKVAEQQAKLLKAEEEEFRLQQEADEKIRKIDAWRQQRILNNTEELIRLEADRKAKDTQRTDAKAVVAKAKKSSPEANFAAATSYRLDEEIAADEKRMKDLKEEIDDDEEEQQRREDEQQKKVEQIRARLLKQAELKKDALKQANQEVSVRRTRGISAEIQRRNEVITRRLAYADQLLSALRGKQLQEQDAKADAKARKAAEKEAKAQATALAKAQRDAEKLAASKAKADAKIKAKAEAKAKPETTSVFAFVGQKMSAFNPLKQATKQVGKNLKELMSERMVTFQGQAAEEQPATVLEVALATKEVRAEAEREKMRQKSQERKRSLSPATALLNKEAAEALIESRRKEGQVSQVKELTEPQKRYEVARIKAMLTAIKAEKPIEKIGDKKLYETLQDPIKARALFRSLRLTPEDQAMFNFTESDIVPKIGRGIEAKPKTWANLGKFLINETLLEQGALSVKTQNGSPIVGFGKKMAVSDNLQAILLDLIETKKLRGLSDLDNQERQMVETLLTKAGLAHGLGVKKIFKPDDDAEKVKRFYMVKGIYDAGNNSIEVKQELRSLIEYFVKTGRLDKRQGMDALTEL